jgi:hypothetical protein
MLATLENPAAGLRFETTTKGDLHVRLKKIEEKEGKKETVQSYLGLLSHGNSKKLKDRVDCLIKQYY